MRIHIIVAIIAASLNIMAQDPMQCKKEWPGSERISSIAFSAEGKGYYGAGGTGNEWYHDLWEYDPVMDEWTEKESEVPIYNRIAFSIGDRGFLLCEDALFEYNPSADSWIERASLPTYATTDATIFVIDDCAYYGWQMSKYAKLYKYCANTDSWTRIADFPGYARRFASTFVINGKGYVCGGWATHYNHSLNDLWEYDPIMDRWETKMSLGTDGFSFAFGTSIDNKGYVGNLKFDNGVVSDIIWQYDQATNSWIEFKTTSATAFHWDFDTFSICSKLYIVDSFKSCNLYEFDPLVCSTICLRDRIISTNISSCIVNSENVIIQGDVLIEFEEKFEATGTINVPVGTTLIIRP